MPAIDLLIAACAQRHGAYLETADSHFELLETVALPTERPPA